MNSLLRLGTGTVIVVLALQQLLAAEDTALTIYSTARPGGIPAEMYTPQAAQQGRVRYQQPIPGYAVVKQERAIELVSGENIIRFSDVAAQIDPTTVSFASLTDAEGTSVLEQDYQFDLVSTAKLMERYLDREITIEQIQGDTLATFTGTLLSTAGGVVLHTKDGGVRVINNYAGAQFPELPGGLITKPTLVWKLVSRRTGEHRSRVSYQTGGMTWWADYNIIFTEGQDANSGVLDIGAWVSIINQSGAGYHDATLKLIAGDVHRAPQAEGVMMDYAASSRARKGGRGGGFEEKAFFEYHLYTLGRPTSLPDQSTKQIELFATARSVPCEKVMVYYGLGGGYRGLFPNPLTDRNLGTQANKKVDTYLRFKNADKNNMGMPLPAGRIRVSKLDPADETLEFIGEDVIDHTPKNEEVLVKMGSAFDVVGERRQVDFRIDTKRDWMDEDIEIKIRNHKSELVNVIVKENLFRWVNWEITQKSHNFDKTDARTVHFAVTVKPGAETVVRYTVHYSW